MARHRSRRLPYKKPKPTIKPRLDVLRLSSLSSLTLSENSQNDLTKCDSNYTTDTECDFSETDAKSGTKSHSPESKFVNLDTNNQDIEKSSASSENTILELLRRLKSYCWRSNASEAEPIPEKHILLPKDQKKKETGKERFENNNINTGEDRATKNVVKPMRPRPDKHTSNNDKILKKKAETSHPRLSLRKSDSEHRVSKAQKIIIAALKYGIANGLVKKNGKHYSLVSKESLKRLIRKNKHRRVPSKTDNSNISKMVNNLSEEDISCLYTRPAQVESSTSNINLASTNEELNGSETDLQSNCKTVASKPNANDEGKNKVRIQPSRTKSAPHKLHSCCEHPSTRKSNISMKRKMKLDKKSLQHCSKNNSSNSMDLSPTCSKKSKLSKRSEDNA